MRSAALAAVAAALLATIQAAAASPEAKLPNHLPTGGIFVLFDPQPVELAITLAKQPQRLVYCQLPSDAQVAAARRQVDQAGLLGTRVYVEKGPWSHIHLADNLADAVIVAHEFAEPADINRDELLRVVNPLGKVFFGGEQFTKPFPRAPTIGPTPTTAPTTIPRAEIASPRRLLDAVFRRAVFRAAARRHGRCRRADLQGARAPGVSCPRVAVAEQADGDQRLQWNHPLDEAVGGGL